METLEKDTFVPPVINSWRLTPSEGQIRRATHLCRSELPYAERVATVASLTVLDSREISVLIDKLAGVREQRMKRLRRAQGRRR